jgi:hypothetical protein
MIDLTTQVTKQMSTLPIHLQRQVLDFIHALQLTSQTGISGKQLLRFAGSIPAEDLAQMRQAIEDGCEQVDSNEW